MKKSSKIVFINLAVAVVISVIFTLSDTSTHFSNFLVYFGLSCMGIGLFDAFIALILFVTGKENHESAKGFLLSCGILLLTGFAVCSGGLSNFKLNMLIVI